MKSAQIVEGDPVRITSGVFAGAEGVVEDLQPQCSAVRIHTKAGTVYGLLGQMEKIMPTVRGNPLKK